MIFTSLAFVIFLLIVFFLYWAVFNKSATLQNVLLLLSSLFFYAWADWRLLIILIFSTLFNYFLGLKISDNKNEKVKHILLWVGVGINIGILGYFKYFNFFYDGFVDLFSLFGFNLHHSSLRIILPLGISFYTFQTLGYIIDVYNEEIEPNRKLLNFSTYVTFFPKLLAGPIERAQKFLPQIKVKREFNKDLAIDGLRQILWGLFAKIVIADNCARVVNPIFENYKDQTGSTLLIGAALYLIQMYGDFSGYSNIAIGVSKLFGIRLMRNFATPFFSTNISDFWRKWHISLTTWMMDYVFTPLSFILRKYHKIGLSISIIITFLIVGLWHGANWTFVVFGLLQGLYFIPLIFKGTINSSAKVDNSRFLPSVKEFFQMLALFSLTMLTWVFLRAENVGVAITYISNIFSFSLFTIPQIYPTKVRTLFLFLFIFIEWLQRDKWHALELDNIKIPRVVRWIIYYSVVFFILFYGSEKQEFIYFQF